MGGTQGQFSKYPLTDSNFLSVLTWYPFTGTLCNSWCLVPFFFFFPALLLFPLPVKKVTLACFKIVLHFLSWSRCALTVSQVVGFWLGLLSPGGALLSWALHHLLVSIPLPCLGHKVYCWWWQGRGRGAVRANKAYAEITLTIMTISRFSLTSQVCTHNLLLECSRSPTCPYFSV